MLYTLLIINLNLIAHENLGLYGTLNLYTSSGPSTQKGRDTSAISND